MKINNRHLSFPSYRLSGTGPLLLVSLLLLLFGLQYTISAQVIGLKSNPQEIRWVDSVYTSLSLDERIAQLLVVRANQPNQPYDSRIDQWIRDFNIGGVTFFRGKAEAQLIQTNRWQQMAKTPLLVSIDAEWGLAMRVDGAVSYPLQMALGAVQDDRLISLMGKQIAEQSKRMGIHMNFAPVIDINNNPANPVIGMRSFGESPTLVTEKGYLYAKALQDNGIIATAKHFPGHGDTYLDSHYTLPSITHTRDHLQDFELYPFQQLINRGLAGIMVAHLYMPAFETRENLAVSLSENVVTALLKQQMKFEGLIVTDALDMKGVTNYFPSGQIELMALAAGNDILLLPEDVPLAISTIRKAIEEGRLPMSRLEESVRKVLSFKYRAGLNTYRPSFTENLMNDLNKPEYHRLVDRLFTEAITVVKNDENLLPLKNMPGRKVASLSVGHGRNTLFQTELEVSGLQAVNFHLPRNPTDEQLNTMRVRLRDFDLVLVSIQNTNILAGRKFGIDDKVIAFVDRLSEEKDVVLNLFASPYAIGFFKNALRIKSIVVSYQDRVEAEQISAAIMTGKRPAKGKLPVTASDHFKLGTGIDLDATVSIPEKPDAEPTATRDVFYRIDSVIMDGIRQKAYPGCQVVAMKDGNIVYNKSFGHHTYEAVRAVQPTDLYDLASLTKVLASTLAVMKLYEDGRLKLNDRLGDYFHYLKGTDKERITIEEILVHHSGLDGWIPFFLETIDGKNGPKPEIYAKQMSATHPFRVADSLYMSKSYRNEMFRRIANSDLKKKEYRYSDMGFYFIPEIVELITNQTFEDFLNESFFHMMGLGRTVFQPLNNFNRTEIVPTELDNSFRMQLLHGDVHDQGAAMLGGISGHAGLFSNAMEVAQIMKMLLNGGSLYGHQYLKPETVNYFTTAHYKKKDNRRGIGFDKPPLNKPKQRTPAEAASELSFGHTGFTGTFAWVDPENKLVVVFLSNRVHPESRNNGISRLSIRTKVHELFYKAFEGQQALIN